MKLIDNRNIKFLVFVVFLAIITFSNSIFAQYKKPTLKNKPYNTKNFNQVRSTIMKADRYESLSEYGKSYNLYRILMRTNSSDPDILNGYVRNSVKTKKIKEC